MTPEGKIEAYLHKRVKATGGDWRRLRWLGRRGAPDDMIWWPNGLIAFVEVKCPGQKPTLLQLAEHKKMRESGLRVFVVDDMQAVDCIIEQLTTEV